MKKLICLIIILLMLPSAFAEITIIGGNSSELTLEEWVTLEDTIDVRAHAVQVSESLGEYGAVSDEKNQFVIVNLDVCNITFDDIDLSAILSAELTYNDRYVFPLYNARIVSEASSAISGTWTGYYRKQPERRTLTLEIPAVNEDNSFRGTWTFGPLDDPNQPVGSYSIKGSLDPNYMTITFEGVEWIIDPGNYRFNSDFYLHLVTDSVLCGVSESLPIFLKKDTSSTSSNVISMLEETSLPLVFECPNRVVEDLENCRLELIINDTRYDIPLK